MASRDTKDEDESPRPKRPSGIALWLEEHWEGWLKPVGGIGLILIAYALYKFDLVSENLAGAALVTIVIVGSIVVTGWPAWGLVRSSAARAAFFALLALWLGATVYPSVRAAIPPKTLAEGKLTANIPAIKLHVGTDKPLELIVSGRLKGQANAEADANYSIKVDGQQGSDEIDGTLKRELRQFRAGRRGGMATSVMERTENAHRLPTARGDLTLTTDGIDEKLEDGLMVSVRPAGPSPTIFYVLGALAILLALGLDARLVDPKTKAKSYLAAGAAFAFVFSVHFPDEATPHALVRPALGAALVAVLIGALGGWVLGAAARLLFGPKLKRARR